MGRLVQYVIFVSARTSSHREPDYISGKCCPNYGCSRYMRLPKEFPDLFPRAVPRATNNPRLPVVYTEGDLDTAFDQRLNPGLVSMIYILDRVDVSGVTFFTDGGCMSMSNVCQILPLCCLRCDHRRNPKLK